MSKRVPAVLLAVVLLVLSGGEIWAHGMTLVLEQRDDVVVATVRYAGGTPVAGADVVIRGPDDATYQAGRTDAGGLFAFVPAHAGEWRVLVDDGLGHRRSARLAFEPVSSTSADDPAGDVVHAADERLDDDAVPGAAAAGSFGGAAAGSASSGPAAETMPWRLATGVSLLFGITGFGYGYAARRRGGTGAA
jgi:hypothetical protein